MAADEPGYPGIPISDRDPDENTPPLRNPAVDDPRAAFLRLRQRPDSLAAHDSGDVWKWKGRYMERNNFRTHFQGIQRSLTGKFLFLSGGDKQQDGGTAQLFVAEMASRPENGPWGTNIRFNGKPPPSDSLIGMYNLTANLTDDPALWHAGGISLMGEVLAVPLENDERSEIHFYDVSNPRQIAHFSAFIDRREEVARDGEGEVKMKAGAVALCQLTNGYYLCGVWAEDPTRVDFYLSNSTSFREGFGPMARWLWADFDYTEGPSYQAVNFLQSGNGTVSMVGTECTSLFNGTDRADLYRIRLDPATLKNSPVLKKPILERLGSIKLEGTGHRDQYYNLAAAGGIHVDREGRLLLYSAHYWRVDNEIRFGECTENLVDGA